MHRIGARIEAAVNAAARPDGLRIEGVRILLRLAVRNGQSINDLAAATSIQQSALSHMTKRMENDGLLKRVKASGDARSVLISLTARGRRLAQKFDPYFQAINELSQQGMTREEQLTLRRALERVFHNVTSLQGLEAAETLD